MGRKKEKLKYETLVRPTMIVEGCPVSIGIAFNRTKRSMGFYGRKRIKSETRGVYHFFAFREKKRFIIRYFHRGWFRKVVFELDVQTVKVDGLEDLPMELSGAIDVDRQWVEPLIAHQFGIPNPAINGSIMNLKPNPTKLRRSSLEFNEKQSKFNGTRNTKLKKTTIDCKIKKELIEP
jgi:hypothetical protein